MSRLLRLGTRQSALAQVQARSVASQLQNAFPDCRIELVFITTSGDRGETSPESNLKALFTKEIEDALLEQRIDLAVHSAKDLGARMPAGLGIAAVPPREDARDAWISVDRTPFTSLRRGARVATGSVRRSAQLRVLRPDLDIVPMRGNVDTRLRKLREERLDGLLLAAAGLRRLGKESEITEPFSIAQMIPAIGQGCLAVQAREADAATLTMLAALDHTPSRIALEAERAFLDVFGGDCQTPLAAYARILDDQLLISGWVGTRDGRKSWRFTQEGHSNASAETGRRLAQRLLDAGAKI